MADLLTGSNGTATFADLGSGVALSSLNLLMPLYGDNFAIKELSFPGNAAFVNAINAHPTDFAIGGTLTFPADPTDAFLFGGSDTSPWNDIRLVMETVPEPGPLLLAAGTLAWALAFPRRRLIHRFSRRG